MSIPHYCEFTTKFKCMYLDVLGRKYRNGVVIQCPYLSNFCISYVM